MGFKTTKEHEAFRERIRAFAEAEIKPYAFQWDQENRFPQEVVRRMAEQGWMGIPYPKEYGGAGLDAISYAIAVEELSRVDGGCGVILSAHTSLGTWPIFAFGTEEQKQKYLVPLATGEKLGAFGLTEPNAGSDAGRTETTAVLAGDHYILNGEKIFITNGGEAEIYVIFAVTNPGIGAKGISAFLVEKGWEGFTFGDHYDKLGIRSSATAQLLFSDVKVPKENLLGQEGQGFLIAMAALDGGSGYLKGMDVERMYRDAKITTIYEGTNEIQRVVIAAHILGKPPKETAPLLKPSGPITGARKKKIFKEGTAQEKVEALVASLQKDGYDFTVGIPMDTPITKAERVVSVGKGIGSKENMALAEHLTQAAGAA